MAGGFELLNQPVVDCLDTAINVQSTESDNSEQASSNSNTRSPQSSMTSSVPPPRAEEWDRTLRHIGLEEFGNSLEKAAKAVFPTDQKSRYSRVFVLLIRWKTQDPNLPVEREIGELRKVLEEVYRYDIEEFLIPDSDSHAEVSEKINAFAKVNNNSCDDLKIVYYAGHSRLSRTKELLWSTLPDKNGKRPIVVWSGIQRSLEMAKSDILILLDCCSSGIANASEGNGVTELICACAFDMKANGVGHYSFTQALITELRLLSKKPCYSVGELYTSIYTRMQSYLPQGIENERYPAPIHLTLTEGELFVRGIKLSVQDPKDSNKDLKINSPKRVHYQDTFAVEEIQGSERSNPPQKRSRLNPSSGSRMEELILRWLDASEPRKDEEGRDEQPKKDDQSSTGNDSLFPHDAPRALFLVRFKDDMQSEDFSVELFREWLRSIPAAAEEVRVEAGFKCFSTLIFITMPFSMCSYIPPHRAVYFLGAVRSSIMLPLEECQNTPFRDVDEISLCASTIVASTTATSTSAASTSATSATALSNTRTPTLTSSPKSRRASKPKVKTGCNNCKNRRVKCDETRPQCNQCVRSRRMCDGYPPYRRNFEFNRVLPTPPASLASSKSNVVIVSPPLLNPTPDGFSSDPLESQYFEVFRTHTAKELSGVFDSNFWTRTVVQQSLSEPSIRHTVIALAALCKTLESSESHPRSPDCEPFDTASNHYSFALQQYGKALTRLRESLQNDERRSQRTVLISIVLFACFQSFTGDHKAVILQIQHGLGLHEERSQESKLPFSKEDPIEDELIHIFTRLAIQAKLCDMVFHFPQPYVIHLTPRFPSIERPGPSLNPVAAARTALLELHIPEVFETTAEAHTTLDSLCEYIMRFKETISENSLPSLYVKVSNVNFKTQLGQWSAAFLPLLQARRHPSVANRERAAIDVLRMKNLMATILICGDTNRSEMDFDSLDVEFKEIVELAREVVDEELSLVQGLAKPSFTFDFEIIPPLFIVATKSRDRKLRREAICLLLSSPRREGLWDSILCGKSAERIVEIEEEGMAPLDASASSTLENVPNEKRVVIKELLFDLQRREGVLKCGPRVTGDGEINLKQREIHISW